MRHFHYFIPVDFHSVNKKARKYNSTAYFFQVSPGYVILIAHQVIILAATTEPILDVEGHIMF